MSDEELPSTSGERAGEKEQVRERHRQKESARERESDGERARGRARGRSLSVVDSGEHGGMGRCSQHCDWICLFID